MFKTICSTLHYEYLYIIVNCERIRIFILKVKTVYQQIVFKKMKSTHDTQHLVDLSSIHMVSDLDVS